MNKRKIIGLILAALAIFVVIYWLSDLVIYVLAAFLISMFGRPLVKFLNERLKLNLSVCSALSLIVVIGVIGVIAWLVFPFLLRQVQHLAELDYNKIASDTSLAVDQIITRMGEKGVHITRSEVNGYITQVISTLWDKINFENILESLTSKISSFSVGLFSTIFVSFFFLRDERLFKKMLFIFIPDKYLERSENVIQSSEHLLSRYFVGLSLEMLIMMILLSLGLWAFGIENAILYGCMGGFLNIIPYLGPVIGTVLTCLLTIFNHIELGFTMDMFWLLVKVVGVFVGCNLIDNWVLQVTIYSTSVKAHPLEIFFVILAAGTLWGIWGMILAIPSYTVLRIFAKEFFKDTKFVRELTKNI